MTLMETVAVLLTRPLAVSVTVNWKLSLPEKPALGVYVRLAPEPLSVPLVGFVVIVYVSGSLLGSVLVSVIALATPWPVATDWLLATGGGMTLMETVAVLL